jgi:hypothetical protein
MHPSEYHWIKAGELQDVDLRDVIVEGLEIDWNGSVLLTFRMTKESRLIYKWNEYGNGPIPGVH